MQTQIIASITNKGGTGKTTTAAILAQAAVYRGYRVLAVDMDPQGNFSYALATRAGIRDANSYNLVTGIGRPDENIIASGTGFNGPGQGLDMIPAAADLATLKSGPGSARRLQEALEPIKGHYDFIFIDAPATVGELQYNALQAATGVIIPSQQDAYNVQSLYEINDLISQFKRSNRDLTIKGFIITCYGERSAIARQMTKNLLTVAASLSIPHLGNIRPAAAISEAAGFRESIYSLPRWRRSQAAKDYLKIFDSIANC